jgi:hypothetical protein
MLPLKAEFRGGVVEDDPLPLLRRVARLAAALIHNPAKFPLVGVTVTRLARERGKMK